MVRRSEGASRGSSRMGFSVTEAMARHFEAELIDRHRLAGLWLGDAAAIDDGDPVRQRQDLIEIIGNEQHRGAGFARLEQALMHIGDGAYIEATRRLAGKDETRIE